MIIPHLHQVAAKEALFKSWTDHQDEKDVPILVLPTGSGKSIIIADVVRTMFNQYPDFHPRTVVLVPSKELAKQNAEKLEKLLPAHVSIGYVSASLGKKQHNTDVIVATIGSIFNSAHLLGNIKCVIIDECHLCSSDGSEHGMYRKFLTNLAKYCSFRTVGLTATPFNKGGYWLTDGENPLFNRIAFNISMRELLEKGFLSPLIPPTEQIKTRIDASSVGISQGDYKVGELSDVVETYLQGVAEESVRLASGRNKWIAFTPSVLNARSLSEKLNYLGISSAVVVGDMPKVERDEFVNKFRKGELRALISVIALSIGFDVPDVDCLIWCRPTKSLNLYVQGFGRACRIAPGKVDALVLDFTDTVDRLGPVDLVKGKSKKGGGDAPYCLCNECGARNHAAALVCAECGAWIKDPPKPKLDATASTAPVLSTQPAPIVWHDVSRVTYSVHKKEGKPDSLRVDYWEGFMVVASEWACFDHLGYARQKAEQWFTRRKPDGYNHMPGDVEQIMLWIKTGFCLKEPTRIATRKNGKYTEIVSHDFNRTENNQASLEIALV